MDSSETLSSDKYYKTMAIMPVIQLTLQRLISKVDGSQRDKRDVSERIESKEAPRVLGLKKLRMISAHYNSLRG